MTATRAVLATGNAHKVPEIEEILGPAFVLDAVDPDVEETGTTFEENALLKARAVAARTGRLALADDSGIEVDALGGEPGMYSARFGGERLDDTGRTTLLLERLTDVPAKKRTARYRAVVALAWPGGGPVLFEGVQEGSIAFEPAGSGGFGYDPVFLVDDQQTQAQISDGEKDQVSHRGQAVRAAAAWLQEHCP